MAPHLQLQLQFLLALAFLILIPGFCSLIVEERVCRLMKATHAIPSGLAASFQAELERRFKKRRKSQVLVFPSVKDQAFIVRSARGDGILLLSQGLLARSDEKAIREVLAAGALKLRGGKIGGTGASIALWCWLSWEKAMSSGFWLRHRKGGPGATGFGSFTAALLLYPWLRLSRRLSKRLWVVCGALAAGDGLFI